MYIKIFGTNARTNNGSCSFGTKMRPTPQVLLPLAVSRSSLCPRPLYVLRRLWRGKTESAQGVMVMRKNRSEAPGFSVFPFSTTLFDLIFHFFFEYPAGATAKERAFSLFAHNANLLLSIFLPSSAC